MNPPLFFLNTAMVNVGTPEVNKHSPLPREGPFHDANNAFFITDAVKLPRHSGNPVHYRLQILTFSGAYTLSICNHFS